MLGSLDEHDRPIFSFRFGTEDGDLHTLDEVQARFDVARERVRQIEAQAFSSLRNPSE